MKPDWRSVFLYPFFIGLVASPFGAVGGPWLGGAPAQWAGLIVVSLPMFLAALDSAGVGMAASRVSLRQPYPRDSHEF